MWNTLTANKAKLERYRPLPPELVRNLEEWFTVELTYTSNALEGNTLTRQETAVVLEKGLTVRGKSLVEHLEATNHAAALGRIKRLAQSKKKGLTEGTILEIHDVILRGIDDRNAGRYRSISVRISGSMVVLPNPAKVPELMARFTKSLRALRGVHPVQVAADAHYELVTIHPFIDGNGRTARLLMNLILLQNGYPPALIRKRDRLRYLNALEKAQLGGDKKDYYQVIADAVNRSFRIYFEALSPDETPAQVRTKRLRIGELAKLSGETHSTLRFWVKEGLLEVADRTESGYQLFIPEMVERARKIRQLQAERFTLSEIRARL